ncbi:50S ribosomal protein L6 [Flavobacteriaceae bacterium Ap0902]|nr:50S ribosomal protein L6 [Flavobacteriaceae bacterium Ap0902]
MSRIGLSPITIPSGITVEVDQAVVTVKNNNKELKQELKEGFKVNIEDSEISIERPSEKKEDKALHGLYRSLINNMVEGLDKGFTKELELVGVGYRASNQGQKLDLSLGFSHNIVIELPEEVKVETVSEKGKNPIIKLSSYDKQLIGMIAAKIRAFRKPEPYKGKGVRFVGENIRRKAGKSA